MGCQPAAAMRRRIYQAPGRECRKWDTHPQRNEASFVYGSALANDGGLSKGRPLERLHSVVVAAVPASTERDGLRTSSAGECRSTFSSAIAQRGRMQPLVDFSGISDTQQLREELLVIFADAEDVLLILFRQRAAVL